MLLRVESKSREGDGGKPRHAAPSPRAITCGTYTIPYHGGGGLGDGNLGRARAGAAGAHALPPEPTRATASSNSAPDEGIFRSLHSFFASSSRAGATSRRGARGSSRRRSRCSRARRSPGGQPNCRAHAARGPSRAARENGNWRTSTGRDRAFGRTSTLREAPHRTWPPAWSHRRRRREQLAASSSSRKRDRSSTPSSPRGCPRVSPLEPPASRRVVPAQAPTVLSDEC